MTSQELAERVAETVAMAQSRIVGVGKQQYEDSNTLQRFEYRTPLDLLRNLREEVIDQINWAVMTDLRLQEFIKAMEEVEPEIIKSREE